MTMRIGDATAAIAMTIATLLGLRSGTVGSVAGGRLREWIDVVIRAAVRRSCVTSIIRAKSSQAQKARDPANVPGRRHNGPRRQQTSSAAGVIRTNVRSPRDQIRV